MANQSVISSMSSWPIWKTVVSRKCFEYGDVHFVWDKKSCVQMPGFTASTLVQLSLRVQHGDLAGAATHARASVHFDAGRRVLFLVSVAMAVDPLYPPPLDGHSLEWPQTWDTAVRTLRMAPGGRGPTWPGAEDLQTVSRTAQVRQPEGNSTDCGVWRCYPLLVPSFGCRGRATFCRRRTGGGWRRGSSAGTWGLLCACPRKENSRRRC